MALRNLGFQVGMTCFLIAVMSNIAPTNSSSHSSDDEEMDEKTKEALKAKAGMDTPGPGELDTILHIANIIPDIIDNAPNHTVKITWKSGAEADLGNNLSPKAVAEQPNVVTWGNITDLSNEENHRFTILLSGPDHPSRKTPNQREFLHWHQVNIHGYSLTTRNTLVEYLAPNPANGTGTHRYVFFVFKQPTVLKFEEPLIGELDHEDPWRFHWNTRQFAKKYNLGDPYAVNFFYSKFEE